MRDGLGTVRGSDRRRSNLGPALLLSVAYTLSIFDWGFISGRGPYWDHLELWDLDRAAALIGWRHFAYDAWRFPLFSVATLSYPEGTNIVFTDSLPLMAALFKLVRQLSGAAINYFGLWMATCYVMQGVAASLLLDALGVRARFANLCGVLVALCAPILLGRFGHGALCAHFLILLALASYFEVLSHLRPMLSHPRAALPWAFLIGAPAATLLITSYLGVMLSAITMAAALECGRRRLVSTAIAIGVPVAMIASAVVVMLVSGMIGSSAPSPVGGGYGYFSMNLLAPLFGGSESYTQRVFGPIDVDATGGQYEGFNYLGAGVLVLAGVCLATSPRAIWRSMRTHPILLAALVLSSLYAAGNEVFWGRTAVLHFTIPAPVAALTGAFRSSGRFFWPAYYMLTLGLIASAWRRFPGPAGLALLVLVAGVQYAETRPMRASVAASARQVHTPHFVSDEVTALAERAERLFVYPSYECTRDDPHWPEPSSWRASIVELMLHTSRRAMPSNSAYVSRGHKDCALERDSLPHETLAPGTLYVVRRADAPAFTRELGAAASCLATEAAFFCASAADPAVADLQPRPRLQAR